MHRTNQERQLIAEELKKIEHKEEKLLRAASRGKNSDGVTGKIREKIPEKMMVSMESAFEKGFTLLFTKGDGIIEKMGGLGKARRQYEIYSASLEKMVYSETLKALDKAASSRTMTTKATSTVEGTGLGAFGMGLPDIPVFLAMLLKTAYEIAAVYGIDYREPEEKRYALTLFNMIFSHGQDAIHYSALCDDIGRAIDDGLPVDAEIHQDDITEVSNILATDLLVAKFLQGVTFIGVIGGPINYAMIHKVARVARIKYKKRFLYRLMNDE